MKLIAKTLAGLEPILANELQALGATEIQPIRRAVTFCGDKRLMYRANLELRTALRILVPIGQFQATHEKEFYQKIRKMDWSRFLDLKDSFAVHAITFSDYFNHSHYIALKTKDAIVDQFRAKTGKRPGVDLKNPKLRIQVYITGKECSIALDSSGESLHKRGYRVASVEAPINEVLAAGLIMMTNWSGDSNFLDPMCGSGTFLIEAAMIALNIPPQRNRNQFGFLKWNDFEPDLWEEVQQDAAQMQRSLNCSILGSDQSFKAIKATQQNILAANLEGKIEVDRKKFEHLSKPFPTGQLLMNPPYDERLKQSDVNVFYSAIGDQLKQEFTGFTAWIISSNKEALKHIGLRPSQKTTVYNGQLECKFQKFEMYQGSKKKVKQESNNSN